jgi:hypothetical protein
VENGAIGAIAAMEESLSAADRRTAPTALSRQGKASGAAPSEKGKDCERPSAPPTAAILRGNPEAARGSARCPSSTGPLAVRPATSVRARRLGPVGAC